MAKKQTRRSISVSGDTYNAVRDYCDEHGLSASGLVTDLLNKYLEDHANGPEEPTEAVTAKETEKPEPPAEQASEPPKTSHSPAPARVSPPQAARDMGYPDRRGPGFTPLPEGASMGSWLVTARIEVSRKRHIDAQTTVETLLGNLVHRRMVNDAQVTKVEQLDD